MKRLFMKRSFMKHSFMQHIFRGEEFSFYFLTMGAVFGLGNLWRFPYVVAENGGGAFVLLYIILTFIVGVPFLINELLFGKSWRMDGEKFLKDENKHNPMSKLLKFGTDHMKKLFLALSFMVLIYLSIVSGWVLYFLMYFIDAFLGKDRVPSGEIIFALIKNDWLQYLFTSTHFLIVMTFAWEGFRNNIRKWINYIIPAFVFLLIVLVIESISLENAKEGLKYFIYPNFSNLNHSSLLEALGHVFFTLSIGCGAVVALGYCWNGKSLLSEFGFQVTVFDLCISVLTGLLIFSLVAVGGGFQVGNSLEAPLEAPYLLFQTVPTLLESLSYGNLVGVGFFLCLYLMALSASIGLFGAVANGLTGAAASSPKVVFSMGALCVGIVSILLLSPSFLGFGKVTDFISLMIFDKGLVKWGLPLSALYISQVAYYKVAESVRCGEFIDGDNSNAIVFYFHWRWIIRWGAPFIILFAFLLEILGSFDSWVFWT